jgi:hypothetical protein
MYDVTVQFLARYRLPMDKSTVAGYKMEASPSPHQSCIFDQYVTCENYRAGCVGPRVLPNHFPNTLLILKSDIKHLGEILTKTV